MLQASGAGILTSLTMLCTTVAMLLHSLQRSDAAAISSVPPCWICRGSRVRWEDLTGNPAFLQPGVYSAVPVEDTLRFLLYAREEQALVSHQSLLE